MRKARSGCSKREQRGPHLVWVARNGLLEEMTCHMKTEKEKGEEERDKWYVCQREWHGLSP